MTRHRCGLWLLALGLVLGSESAWAQQQSAGIPAQAREAADVSPYQGQIDAFIQQQVEALQAEQPVTQQEARDALVGAVQAQGSAQPSPAYLRAFNVSLNRALMAMPADAPVRGRLNAAIALQRVAEAVQAEWNRQLVPAALKFMQDPDQPVALWGMKVAEEVLPYELQDPLVVRAGDSRVLATIPKVLGKHGNGALYEEAYYALSLKVDYPQRTVLPKAVRMTVPLTQQIFEERVKAMQAEPIDQPHAEMRAMYFLSNPRTFPQETPEQQLKSVQLIMDFTGLLAQRMAGSPEDAARLLPIIRYAGNNIVNIGSTQNNADVRSAAQQLGSIRDDVRAAQVQAMVQGLYDALKADPAFAKLQTQPQIDAGPAEGEAGNAAAVAAQAAE